MKIKFIVIAYLWYDKVNGNSYFSCRVLDTMAGKEFSLPFQYGCGCTYREAAIAELIKRKVTPFEGNIHRWERENGYPVRYIECKVTRREAIAYGKLPEKD